MTYTKPELVALTSALGTIQAGYKLLTGLLDAYLWFSIGAYEADE